MEIISNCDLLDLEDTVNTNDISDSTHEPNRSLTTHTSSETTEKIIPSTDTSKIEFIPVINSCNTLPLHREVVDNHQSKPSKKKRLL